MSPAVQPALEDVLEAFMLDCGREGALADYLRDYPQFAAELVDLAHEMSATIPDEPPTLDEPCRLAIRKGWEQLRAAWPQTNRNLFAGLSPADYGRVASEVDVPRQILAAIRDGGIIMASIPASFMRRLGTALSGTAEELGASVGRGRLQAQYKSEERPEAKPPVTFEQALIDARVSDEQRARLLAD
jgi:hypothetical protein